MKNLVYIAVGLLSYFALVVQDENDTSTPSPAQVDLIRINSMLSAGLSKQEMVDWLDEDLLNYRMASSRLSSALDSLSISDLELFCRPPLMAKQKTELSANFSLYRSRIRDAKRKDIPKIRSDCLIKISETLLPEQQDSLSEKLDGERLISHLLIRSNSEKLEITKTQQLELVAKSKQANSIVKAAIIEQREILERCRSKIRTLCDEVLTEKQLRKIDIDVTLSKMSTMDLDSDTEFHSE